MKKGLCSTSASKLFRSLEWRHYLRKVAHILSRHRPASPVIAVHVREGAAEMDVDVRPLPGLFEQSLGQISAAYAFSSREEACIQLFLVVAVGALQQYYAIASLMDGSKQECNRSVS